MPYTNGHGRLGAVLYARVSTDEQARSGYSLAQQMEALRDYAAREGYEVLEEIADPGQSGASLERPGMDRVRDLVAEGGVSVVLAQDRDRFAREPAYHYLLRREFEEHGCKMHALNDRGDDSPEGELTDGILDQLAKFERAKTAERSRRGKVRKAKEGRVVGAQPRPRYGFAKSLAAPCGYVPDEEKMTVVRRIFCMIGAEGASLHRVQAVLESEGVPAPSGGRRWSRTTLRGIVLDDCYRPHPFEEVAALVAPAAAMRLDPDALYGVSWWGRRKTSVKQVAGVGADGQREYRRKQAVALRPRGEWIAVPVPASGVPREMVDAARARVEDNQTVGPPSTTGGHFFELSGGVIRCGDCGKRMTPDKRRKHSDPGNYHLYYRCITRPGIEHCPNRKSHRAEELESAVWHAVSGLLLDPETLREDLDRMIEIERGSAGDGARHTGDAERLFTRLSEIDGERRGYQRLAAKGHMSDEELEEALSELAERRKVVEAELDALKRRQERVSELEQDRDALLDRLENVSVEALNALTPEERRGVYSTLRLEVRVHLDGPLEMDGAFGNMEGFGSGSEAVEDNSVCKAEHTYL